METVLRKKISPSQMIKLFDLSEINIRYYNIVENRECINDFEAKVYYDIRIRHNEDFKAKDILNNALKVLCSS